MAFESSERGGLDETAGWSAVARSRGVGGGLTGCPQTVAAACSGPRRQPRIGEAFEHDSRTAGIAGERPARGQSWSLPPAAR